MKAALVALCSLGSAVVAFPAYQTKWFNQTLDHFDDNNKATWSQRYLFNDDHWTGAGKLPNGCKGPILLYTGNEGPITAFWGSNGFMIEELAPKWNALLVFPEERYYGESLPFGDPASFTADNMEYLSTEQVLADYANVATTLKATLPGAANCPVVAFGGSYGGTLTTFFRAAYPDVTVGGLAASAPVGYYDPAHWSEHGVDAFTWSDIVTKVFAEADPQCMDAIHAATEAIVKTPVGELVSMFHTCDARGLGPTSTADLFHYALEALPQQNYPYETGNGLGGWPVNSTCKTLVDGFNSNAVLKAAVAVTDLVMGYDGKNCMPTMPEGPGGVPGDGPGQASEAGGSWGYQSCSENLHQFSARGVRDYTFNFDDNVKLCNQLYNKTVYPNTTRLTGLYGGYGLASGDAPISNVIWSNGLLDPWHGGGFLTPGEDGKDGKHWIIMAKGAHHLDLRGPHPEDPAEVTAARQQEEDIIWGWIEAASRAESS